MECMPELPKGYYWKLKQDSVGDVRLKIMKSSWIDYEVVGTWIFQPKGGAETADKLQRYGTDLAKELDEKLKVKNASTWIDEFNEAAKPKRIPYKGRSF